MSWMATVQVRPHMWQVTSTDGGSDFRSSEGMAEIMSLARSALQRQTKEMWGQALGGTN